MATNQTRDGALDTAKAIAILLVFFWHIKPLAIGYCLSESTWDQLTFALNVFYKQVSLVAVPTFILVSLQLLYDKLDTQDWRYVIPRMRRLALLFAVWTLCQFVFFYGSYAILEAVGGGTFTWPRIAERWHIVIMQGGPPLPIAGGSVFYYLFDLTILCGVAAAFHGAIRKSRYATGIAAGIAALCLCAFQYYNWAGKGLDYYRLDNFLIYVPLAYLIRPRRQTRYGIVAAVLFVGFVLLVLQDIFIREHLGGTGAYSRPSVVLGAVALLYALRATISRPTPKPVAFLAQHSLGIFALHRFWWVIIGLFTLELKPLCPTSLLNVTTLVKALFCLAGTCGTAYLIGKTRLKLLVR
ncbi:MAG: acyltransferase family protein [Verrucomicrobia bacterium]|nr:acyltransferase family protein [Verrucomicrobiota bacterium]